MTLPMGHREDGFTLIELLIFIAISSVIIGAIAGAFIAGFRTTAEADQRMLESHDRQIVAAWFANDVQSAGTQPGDIRTTTGCGETTTPLVSFVHRDFTSGSEVTSTVSYTLNGSRIERRRCSGNPQVVSSNNLIASQLSLTTPPSVVCDVVCTTPARSVTLSVTDESGRSYSLRGNRRTT